MYCYIQYIEISKNQEEMPDTASAKHSIQTVQSLSPTTKMLMVNPNCPAQILLDYVCSVVDINKNSPFDFCDIETGEMVGIKQLKPWSYATNVLKSNQTYIIVFYEKDEFGQYITTEPFLSKQSRQYSEILLKITRQLNMSKSFRAAARKSKHGSTSSRGSNPDSHKDLIHRKGSLKKSSSKNNLKHI